VSHILLDTKFVLRQFWKDPRFSLTVIISLALGIAATVTVFSVIYIVLLHPTPYPDADRIVTFVNQNEKNEVFYTPPIYREQISQLRSARSIEDVVEMDESNLTDTSVGVPQDTDVVFLSGNAFPFFGLPALLGRTFLPSDAPEDQAPQPVAVLTYQYWKRRFNGNPAIVGQMLRLDGRAYTILGVMPKDFTWWDCDIYLPLDTSPTAGNTFMMVLKIRSDYSKAQVMREIRPILDQMIREHPHSLFEGMNLQLMTISDRFTRSLGKILYFIFAAVFLLLLIACLNVSILLLARGNARQHEFAVRAAVGAQSKRIFGQLLTESLILGLAAAILGILVTYGCAAVVGDLLPWQLFTRGIHIPVRIPVLLFAIALAVLTSIVFGLFPALQFSRPDIRKLLLASSSKTSTVSRDTLHRVLIAAQIALALVLLTVAITAIGSFQQLLRTDLGYNPKGIAVASIPIHPGSYSTWEARANYFRQLRDHVAQIPGVLSVSLAVTTPPSSDWDFPIEILGLPSLQHQISNIDLVDSGFFRNLGVPLLRGRLWGETETSRGARLAIVNQVFARKYFPNGDVLGHSIRLPDLVNHPPRTFAVAGSNDWLPIIGVVGNVRNAGLDQPVKPAIYLPYSFYMIDWLQILYHAHGDPLAYENAVKSQVATVNPEQQVAEPIVTMNRQLERQPEWGRARILAVLSSGFSSLALFLAAVGLYSVVSYTVTARFRELGIRIALGARPQHVLMTVFLPLGISAASGLLIGTIVSVVLHHLLLQWINIKADYALLLLGGSILVIMTAAASILPAYRALKIPPMTALREE